MINWSELIIFVVAGLTTGAVYALAGIGLVLTYRTSGVFNFAQGALATISAYVFWTLTVSHGWSWPLAALVDVLGVGVVMGLVLEPLARRLRYVSLPLQVAATVGLALAIQSVIALIYPDSDLRQVVPFLPQGGFTLSGAPVHWSDVITLAFALVATAVLTLTLRYTRVGIATRALVDDDQLLALHGVEPRTVRRGAWITGSLLAAASGVLFAPLLPLNSVQLTLLVVSAFGAAAVGRFTSLPLTFVGGLLIGVGASLITRYVENPVFEGLAPSLPFLVLFVLILFRRRAEGQFKLGPVARGSTWSAPWQLQAGLAGVVLIALAFVPSFAGFHIVEWIVALASVILFLSLSLLVRTSGQVSLCHVAFTAIGATAFSHFKVDDHLPWLLALILAGLVAVPIGAVLSIPAIRLSGLYLALATFGFGILLQYMFYTRDFMFGATGLGLQLPRPSAFSSDKAYYYVVLVCAVVCALGVVALTRSRLGRLSRGIGDAPTALETTGASTNVTLVLIFCLSAFLAAFAGALIGVARTTVSVDTYPPLLSLTYLVLIVIVVGRAPWDALMAGLALVLVPSYVSGGNVPIWLQLIFGASAVLAAVFPQPGLSPAVIGAIDRTFRRSRPTAPTAVEPKALIRHAQSTGSGLEAADVAVHFGGLVALDHVSVNVPLGLVTGLIGPNGAGKTTFFNAVSGLNRPQSGAVRLNGHDLSRYRPGARARAGLGRTFQDMRLFDSLTVRENVALGREGSYANFNPLSHVGSGASAHKTVRGAADEAIALCGLGEIADHPVRGLSTGQRRLVDLARCVAGEHTVLLLDEPSSGLDVSETRALGAIVKRLVQERGIGVLLVEHDLPLVLDLCSNIYVLDFGKSIFTGNPAEVQASPAVQAAYLGDAAVEDMVESESPTMQAGSR